LRTMKAMQPARREQAPRVAPGFIPGAGRPAGPLSLLVFHLSGQAYGLPLAEVAEVVPMALLSRAPGLPPLLAGFLNLAGTAVPVLRTDRLFGLPDLTPGCTPR